MQRSHWLICLPQRLTLACRYLLVQLFKGKHEFREEPSELADCYDGTTEPSSVDRAIIADAGGMTHAVLRCLYLAEIERFCLI